MLDITGALISLLCTYYFIRLDNKAWLIGLCASVLNAGLYWQKGIYADMLLECFYFCSTSYGLYLWRKKIIRTEYEITALKRHHWWLLLLAAGCLFVLIKTLLILFTTSNVATLDALTASFSLIAQWLMAHKIINTWMVWFFTDAVYAWLYFYKQIPFHVLLMLIYMGMAVLGYCVWARKCLKNYHRELPAPGR